MFLNYNNIANNYIPNNLVCSFPVGKSYTKLDPVKASKPYEELDSKGNLIGYSWKYGETLNLEFNIDGEITVEDDALLFTQKGQKPSPTTGFVSQRAYNVVDYVSWTCIAVVNGVATWVEDVEFTYDESCGRSVYVTADEYLQDKTLEVTLYNFRMEPIHKQIFEGTSKVILFIDKQLSAKLKKGIYYCSLSVITDSTILPIFDSHDCTLLVK